MNQRDWTGAAQQSFKGMAAGWRFFADRGGTFTDLVALGPSGRFYQHKLLSRSPGYGDPVMEGVRQILQGADGGKRKDLTEVGQHRTDSEAGIDSKERKDSEAGIDSKERKDSKAWIDPEQRKDSQKSGESEDAVLQPEDVLVQELRVGTTLGTNALLEHKIARVGLVTTGGFADLIRIGYQARPELFAQNILLPEMLYSHVREVEERTDARGNILVDLKPASLHSAVEDMIQAIDCLAVVFLHSVQNPTNEIQAKRYIQAHWDIPVYLSHESSPLTGAVARGDTTLIDAALGPLIQDYAKQLQGSTERVFFMSSAGTLMEARRFTGKDSLLSGPAGGVNAVARLCQTLGVERAVGFDMGGTSTDVFTCEGELERLESTEIAGYRIQAPHLRIHTIASGGGSILQRQGSRLLVGPESAGAQPGPAFYGNGGPATVTDANVMLGRLVPHRFSPRFGPRGTSLPDAHASRSALLHLLVEDPENHSHPGHEGSRGTGNDGKDKELCDLADGFLSIACEQMAGAVRKMTIEQGRDPESYALVSFGGAGGQVACEVAERAGMKRILFPSTAGVFSAVGIACSEHSELQTWAVEKEIGECYDSLYGRFQDFWNKSRKGNNRIRLEFRLLPPGSDFSINMALDRFPDLSFLRKSFQNRFRELYGYDAPGEPVLRSLLLELYHGGEIAPEIYSQTRRSEEDVTGEEEAIIETNHRLYIHGWQEVNLYRRNALTVGSEINGPALIVSDTDTVLLGQEWKAVVSAGGHLDACRHEATSHPGIMEDVSSTETGRKHGVQAAVAAEIHQRRLESIAIEMGTVLQKTARSVNIKERLDFSCAIFDAEGRILVSAPHIPVHLGSMQDSVQAILAAFPSTDGHPDKGTESDFYLLNNPYRGGTHLPDITVILPVRGMNAGTDYFVAARGHHADVGGSAPGSMPSRSGHIEEEGLLISPMGFRFSDLEPEGALHRLFQEGGARNPEMNRADISAQVAACIRGQELIQRMQKDQSRDRQAAGRRDYSAENSAHELLLRRAASRAVEQFILGLPEDLDRSVEMRMDPEDSAGQHARIHLRLRREGSELVLDFRKSSPPVVENFQTPPSVVRSAVIYSLYLMAGRSIPLNSGALEPVRILLQGTFLQAREPMPVVAGNVETSQVLVDAILFALEALSPGPGTMNNLSFGNHRFQYYETIGSGSGAGPGFPGTSAIQCHMTNSRMTDVEILEQRFPVLLEEFSIRRGSGGAGEYSGGDGLIRQMRFLEGVELSVLSNRRKVSAPGLKGGKPGKKGINLLIQDGRQIALDYCHRLDLKKGDAIRIETPGGAGYGLPPDGL